MKKNHIIALIIAALVLVVFLPMAYFEPDILNNPMKHLLSFIAVLTGSLMVVFIGSTNPVEK